MAPEAAQALQQHVGGGEARHKEIGIDIERLLQHLGSDEDSSLSGPVGPAMLAVICDPLVLVALAMAASACNTVQGIGKDIERGGQAIEKAAR